MSQEITIKQRADVAHYIPFQGRQDIGPEADQPVPDNVTLSYCTGRNAMQRYIVEATGEEKKRRISYAGLFTDIGVDPELDKAMRDAGFEKAFISHQQGATEHWIFPAETEVFLIAQGLQTLGQMRATTERKGLAWGERKNEQGKKRSYFYAQVLIKALLPYYKKPMILCLKSTQTDDGLNLFRAQYKVLRFAHEVLQAQGKDMPLPLWSYALTIVAASEQSTRGVPPFSSDIFPIIALLPRELNVEYLQTMEMEALGEYVELFKSLAARSVEWSSKLVAKIAADEAKTTQIEEAPVVDEPAEEE